MEFWWGMFCNIKRWWTICVNWTPWTKSVNLCFISNKAGIKILLSTEAILFFADILTLCRKMATMDCWYVVCIYNEYFCLLAHKQNCSWTRGWLIILKFRWSFIKLFKLLQNHSILTFSNVAIVRIFKITSGKFNVSLIKYVVEIL